MKRKLIVVVSSDFVGRRMAGPAIRAVELARVLAKEHPVVLAAPNKAAVDGLEVVSFMGGRLARLVREAKVVVGQGLGVPLAPLLSPGHALVLDFYDPNPVELLAFHRVSPRRLARRSQEVLRYRLLALARRGDLFLCATERQRDFWFGLLAACGRLSWEADRGDPNLDNLVATLPFGLPAEPPHAAKPVLKGVWPGIGPGDKVLLWGGGIWNWFDPLTVIKAVGRAAKERPDVRLFFLGVSHPNPRIPAMAMTGQAIALAEEMGLLNRVVFFNHGWVDYEDRAGFLLESDLAILASGRDLETRLSFRTRLLDALWAGLPMVLTEGDHFAEMVSREGLGRAVGVADEEAMARAILGLLNDEAEAAACRTRIKSVAQKMTWPLVAEPLIKFCAAPRHHPGAAHGPLDSLRLMTSYTWGLGRVALRYGGGGEYLKRRLARKGSSDE